MHQENQEIERRDLSEPFSAWPLQGGSLSRVSFGCTVSTPVPEMEPLSTSSKYCHTM